MILVLKQQPLEDLQVEPLEALTGLPGIILTIMRLRAQLEEAVAEAVDKADRLPLLQAEMAVFVSGAIIMTRWRHELLCIK